MVKNTLVGILGGPLPQDPNVELQYCKPAHESETIRFEIFDAVQEQSKLPEKEHLALIVDSNGGALMNYLCWLGILTDPNIESKTAYVANHAASAAAMVATSADKIVCLPTTKFLFHFGSGVSEIEQDSELQTEEILAGFKLTIDSLIEFMRDHLAKEDHDWFLEKVLQAFYVDREKGIEDVRLAYRRKLDPETMSRDTNMYKNDGELVLTGAELAEKGAVELVGSVQELEQRYQQDLAITPDEHDTVHARIEDLFRMSRIVEVLRRDNTEAYVAIFGDTFVFTTKDQNQDETPE